MTPRLSLLVKWAYSLSGASQLHCRQPRGAHFRPGELNGYFIDYSCKLRARNTVDGVPANQLADGTTCVIPTAVAQYGLGGHEAYLNSSDKRFRDIFNRCVRWLVENQDCRGGWQLGSLMGESAISPYSCLTQAQGASVLLRGFVTMRDRDLLGRARAAIEVMLTEVSLGGTARYPNGELVLEEIPKKELDPILNGWLFALLGLHEVAAVDANPRYNALFQRGCQTLELFLDQYDAGFWSFYDLKRRLASPFYHDLHVALLSVLADVYSNERIARIKDRWIKYSRNRLYRCRALAGKVIEKLRDPGESIVVR